MVWGLSGMVRGNMEIMGGGQWLLGELQGVWWGGGSESSGMVYRGDKEWKGGGQHAVPWAWQGLRWCGGQHAVPGARCSL